MQKGGLITRNESDFRSLYPNLAIREAAETMQPWLSDADLESAAHRLYNGVTPRAGYEGENHEAGMPFGTAKPPRGEGMSKERYSMIEDAYAAGFEQGEQSRIVTPMSDIYTSTTHRRTARRPR